MGIRILIPRPRRRTRGVRTRRFLWLAAAAALWGILYTAFGNTGVMGVYRAEAQVQELQDRVAAARAENERLTAEVEALRSDPLAIEREARERLGLVKEGDKVYLLPESSSDDASSPEAAPLPPNEAIPGPDRRP